MFKDKKMILRRIWWGGLVGVGSYYFYTNYSRISTEPTAIDNAILVALLILVFMPLVSEISAFGMTVKKEVQQVKEEIRGEISTIRNDILSLAINNNNNQHVYLGLDKLPSTTELEEVKKESADKGVLRKAQVAEDFKLLNDFKVSNEQKFLYKTRYALEMKLNELGEYHGLNRYKVSRKLAAALWKYGVISNTIYDKIEKVLSICNRGIHGELIKQDYIDYVKSVINEISKEFDQILSEKPMRILRGFTVCSRCGYSGDTEYDNVCPKCGFVSDEY